jgi:hypothetical protein
MHSHTARAPRSTPPPHDCPRTAPHDSHPWRDTRGSRRTYTCPGVKGAAPDSTIRLRRDAFTPDALRSYGWESATAAARAVGIHSSTLRRAIAGKIAPGERLIAALIVGTGRSFDALFQIVTVSRADTPLPLYAVPDAVEDVAETV